MLEKILYSLIPLISAFPLFMMLVEMHGRRPSGRQWFWFAFSVVFFVWHGVVARFIAPLPETRPLVPLGDLLLIFAFTLLFIQEENRKSQEPIQNTYILKGCTALVVYSAILILSSYCVDSPIFLIPLFATALLAFYFDRLYSSMSYYPKPRLHLVYGFFILSVFLVLPVFRLFFLFQIAYVFARRYRNWIAHKDRIIAAHDEERKVNHKIVAKMGETVNDFSDLHESLAHFLENLAEGIDAKSAAIYVWDEQNGLFRCSDIYGVFFPLTRGNEMSFTHVEALREIALAQNITEPDNIIWTCGMSQTGAFIPYANQDSRILSLESRAANIRSVIVEPLNFNQQLLGVLVVENKLYERYFSESDYYLVQNFAHYATMILKANEAVLERQNQARTQAELQLGFHIQSGLLPHRIPQFEGISLSGSMTPAKEIGGDYFDFLTLPNGNLGIVIGDVSGKGVPAGMVMTTLYAFLHAECRYFVNTYRALVNVNAELSGRIAETMFASLLFFEWNPRTKALHYTSCGHEHILHFRQKENRLDTIKSGGIALGMIDDNSKIIREKSLLVQSGDMVLLYTDGVTEAVNDKREMFGLSRLQAFVEKYHGLSSEEIRIALLDELKNFAHGAALADDITVLVMKF
ncbi:GAF domain-containing SpoIIE family protein phosphatase [Fibrobacter sp. UWS1]|uniref:GAF domain-containing SpoIIE family protein phosphatase n=1 Tax=Fibrobacter sp. UWS1 TaxID=1896220 RepID=UPI000BB0D391|nr:PP2C family protein-serine/threonine phosphatase [Fibrobacter sp. UWS1]